MTESIALVDAVFFPTGHPVHSESLKAFAGRVLGDGVEVNCSAWRVVKRLNVDLSVTRRSVPPPLRFSCYQQGKACGAASLGEPTKEMARLLADDEGGDGDDGGKGDGRDSLMVPTEKKQKEKQGGYGPTAHVGGWAKMKQGRKGNDQC